MRNTTATINSNHFDKINNNYFDGYIESDKDGGNPIRVIKNVSFNENDQLNNFKTNLI